MLSLFKSSPLIDELEESWILDTFLWAYELFDGQYFDEETQVILPTPAFFPKQLTSLSEMAAYIFNQVVDYSGMQNWPIQLVSPDQIKSVPFPTLTFKGRLRGKDAVPNTVMSQYQDASWPTQNEQVLISFNPNQMKQPQDLIASFSQTLAMVLITNSRQLPPGGEKFVPQASELLGCFLGFGVMLSNTAYHFRGSCGSCFNAYANRQSVLSEAEVIYVTALVAKLKNHPSNKVNKQLKPHLRSMYKKANKQIDQLIDRNSHPFLSLVKA